MTLTVQDVRLGNGIVAFRHQRHLHLVLDLLHGDAIVYLHTTQDVGHHLLGGKTVHREESLLNGILDFVG